MPRTTLWLFRPLDKLLSFRVKGASVEYNHLVIRKRFYKQLLPFLLICCLFSVRLAGLQLIRPRIAEITFKGNTVFSDAELRDSLTFSKVSSEYRPERFEREIELDVLRKYRKTGYALAKAHVSSVRIEEMFQAGVEWRNAHITITMSEGPLSEGFSWKWVDGKQKERTREDLDAILRSHQTLLKAAEKWDERDNQPLGIDDISDLDGGTLADLKGAILDSADLRGVDLRLAELSEADLNHADLRESDLGGAWLVKTNLQEANLSGANLIMAHLAEADLNVAILVDVIAKSTDFEGAYLSGADFLRADLAEANLGKTNFRNASLREAELWMANLTGARLDGADLSGAILFRANLQGATLTRTNLTEADVDSADFSDTLFEPSALPPISSIASAQGLTELRFRNPSSIIRLRTEFRNAGFYLQEREVTFSLNRVREIHGFEDLFRYVMFELTCQWGMSPNRPLKILGMLIIVLAVPYCLALGTDSETAGIWKVWHESRVLKEMGSDTPEKFRSRGLMVLVWALYFSILSAFHFGWRDLNIGHWIMRMQTREYAFRATGWVRTVSGVQSLVSVYLLALWALVYFGRPFG